MTVRIQLRHDTTENWEKANPILLKGEVGVETDREKRIKIGDGITEWVNLPYFDINAVHKYADETISGKKVFKDELTIGDKTNPTKSYLTVYGTINGTVDKAINDGNGNKLDTYYQKKLSNTDIVVENLTDWNEITNEGIYSINIGSVQWNKDNGLHQPCMFDPNISRQGFLIVHRYDDNNIIQTYYPTGYDNKYTVNMNVYRTLTNAVWSDWKTFGTDDNTLVHINNKETIAGEKTFRSNTTFESDINMSHNKQIKFGNTSVLRHDTNTVLSSDNEIIFRPNDIDNELGQVVIDGEGNIHCNSILDNNDNEIYAKTDELEDTILTTLLKESELKTSTDSNVEIYNTIVDKKYSSFDLSKFEVVGNPTITDDGIASGFSNANYLTNQNVDFTSIKTFKIDVKFTTGVVSTGRHKVIFHLYNSNNHNTIKFYENDGSRALCFNIPTSDSTSEVINLGTAPLGTHTASLQYNESSLNVYIDGVLKATREIDIVYIQKLYSLLLGTSGNDAYNQCFTGSIDLKHFSITVDDKEVFCGRETGLDCYKEPDYSIIELEEQSIYKYSCTTTDPETSEVLTHEIYADSDTLPTLLYNLDKTLYIDEEFAIVTELVGDVETTSIKYNDIVCTLVAYGESTIPNNITVTEDGIISNFSNTNYIKKEVQIPENYEIIIPFKLTDDTIPQGIARFDDADGNTVIDIKCQDNIIITGYGPENATSELTITDLDTTQQMYLRIVKDGSSLIVKYSTDYENWLEEELEKDYDLNQIQFINIGSISNELNPLQGGVDMNLLNIYVNDKLYLYPCLNIPFTYADDGTKVVDYKYFYRLSNLIDNYKTANYFVLNEKDNQFLLPYDSLNGYCRQLKQWRKGAESYEYDTNLECVQTGSTVAETPVIFKKPFADDSYYISTPYVEGSKTREGFTPTENGIYYAKGRVFLE